MCLNIKNDRIGNIKRSSIEDIILQNDRRNISRLRPFLAKNYCFQAAKTILSKKGKVIIITGFFVQGAAETDGPPGALFIGFALEKIGMETYWVTDSPCLELLQKTIDQKEKIINFPILDSKGSKAYAEEILKKINPACVISIERCGINAQGKYVNMFGDDISLYTAKIDYLVNKINNSIGIGDGGNEIGMGLFVKQILHEKIFDWPCVTRTKKLVIASVSNWGAYGVLAALSQITRKMLLPDYRQEQQLIKKLVDYGAVNGLDGKRCYRVDDFDLEQNSKILKQLRLLLKDKIGLSV